MTNSSPSYHNITHRFLQSMRWFGPNDPVSLSDIRQAGCTGDNTLLRWYVLHVLFFPFIIVIFMAIHFWRVRKDGGISGPL